ncbi:MAG: hypothetical protein HRT72_03785 [Flavobacteriales bacterium]|nr:hypothetical protein [Flavobacteriales bacterium]
MANKRNLKKAVNELIFDIIEECFSAEIDNPEKNTKDANSIIEEAVQLRNTLISKISSKVDQKERKKHFASITDGLSEGVNALLAKVDKLS